MWFSENLARRFFLFPPILLQVESEALHAIGFKLGYGGKLTLLSDHYMHNSFLICFPVTVFLYFANRFVSVPFSRRSAKGKSGIDCMRKLK